MTDDANDSEFGRWARSWAPGLKASDGERIELAEGGTRLALPGGDFLQIGDSALLFWHRGQWRRGQIVGYDKDRQGAPIANVRLLDAPGLPSENIAVRAGARAMREPLTMKARDDDDDGDDILFAADLLAAEVDKLIKDEVARLWAEAQAKANAPKGSAPKPTTTTKETKAKRITTTKGTISFKG